MWPALRARASDTQSVIESSRMIASKWKILNAFVTECWDKASDDASRIQGMLSQSLAHCIIVGNAENGLPESFT